MLIEKSWSKYVASSYISYTLNNFRDIPQIQKQNISFQVAGIILSLGVLLSFQYAYADVPNIDTFTADDPDDGDTVYSDGDTFTLIFSLPINVTAGATMSQVAINGNFTLSGGASFGATYSGLWSADKLTLVITVTDVTGATIPAIGVTTISASGTSNLGHDGDPPTSATLTGTPTLGGDYGQAGDGDSGGSRNGCAGDCMAPTLGVNEEGNRLVTNGFTYNVKPIDVERYFTPYPLITVEVGKKNTAVFKIYEDSGPQNIQHFDFAFGLADGQIIGESKAVIRWDRGFDGIETVTLVDPDNVLGDVNVSTSTEKCTENSAHECLAVTVEHTFRESPEFNIVGTNAWDTSRNAWQNYYNDGIDVVGESMNPPKQHVGIHDGHLITITETAKNKAIDEEGNTWTFDTSWEMDYIPKGKIVDEISTRGYDRNHALFSIYKKGQILVAASTLKEICEKCVDEPFSEIENIFSYEFPERLSKLDDPEVQKNMKYEALRAEKLLQNLFSQIYRDSLLVD